MQRFVPVNNTISIDLEDFIKINDRFYFRIVAKNKFIIKNKNKCEEVDLAGCLQKVHAPNTNAFVIEKWQKGGYIECEINPIIKKIGEKEIISFDGARPAVTIGENSWIEASQFLPEKYIVPKGTIIGHNTMVKQSVCFDKNIIIGDNSVIESSTKIARNSQVGNNCYIEMLNNIGSNVFIKNNTQLAMGCNIALNSNTYKKFWWGHGFYEPNYKKIHQRSKICSKAKKLCDILSLNSEYDRNLKETNSTIQQGEFKQYKIKNKPLFLAYQKFVDFVWNERIPTYIGKSTYIGRDSCVQKGCNIGNNNIIPLFSEINKSIPHNELSHEK